MGLEAASLPVYIHRLVSPMYQRWRCWRLIACSWLSNCGRHRACNYLILMVHNAKLAEEIMQRRTGKHNTALGQGQTKPQREFGEKFCKHTYTNKYRQPDSASTAQDIKCLRRFTQTDSKQTNIQGVDRNRNLQGTISSQCRSRPEEATQ